MNARDYGQHASGYRRPELDELPRGFMVRLILWPWFSPSASAG